MKNKPLAQYGFNGQVLQPFNGQLMTCILCGLEEQSTPGCRAADPEVLSDWRAVQLSSDLFYACPDEFPPDGASSAEYEAAYTRFLEAAIKKRAELVAARRASILRAIRGPNGKLKKVRRSLQ